MLMETGPPINNTPAALLVVTVPLRVMVSLEVPVTSSSPAVTVPKVAELTLSLSVSTLTVKSPVFNAAEVKLADPSELTRTFTLLVATIAPNVTVASPKLVNRSLEPEAPDKLIWPTGLTVRTPLLAVRSTESARVTAPAIFWIVILVPAVRSAFKETVANCWINMKPGLVLRVLRTTKKSFWLVPL